jgi:acetylornithine deacetylase/succinyl-diaminopimelate desuccinylase-like protein
MPGRSLFLSLAILASSHLAVAAPADVARAREILAYAVAVPTVAGRGRVPTLARWMAEQLRKSGFASNEIEIIPIGETAALMARYPGRDRKLPALVLSVHMDVVGAEPKDWERDPFALSEANGFLYGRGVVDDKWDMSLLIATLGAMRHQGFQPARDIVLAISGDEETTGATSRVLAERLKGAWLVINGDWGNNRVRADGTPEPAVLQTAEKTRATYEFQVTNAGGHSSVPREDNAIHQLAAALTRLAAYRFPAELNETTRAYMEGYADQAPRDDRDALLAVARNSDPSAVEKLSQNAEYNAILRTTCVPTMLNSGIAENVLPQHATSTINCRIMPGVAVEAVTKQLQTVIADPDVHIVLLTDDVSSPVSPMRKDVMIAVQKALDQRYPGLRVISYMSAGGTDNRHFRAVGIDSYAIGSFFMHAEDEMMHAANERVPAAEIAPALAFWDTLIRELTDGSPEK